MKEEGRPRKKKGTTGTVLRAMPGHPTPLPAQIPHRVPTQPRPPEQVQKPVSPRGFTLPPHQQVPPAVRTPLHCLHHPGLRPGRCLPCLRVAFPEPRCVCKRLRGGKQDWTQGEFKLQHGCNCNRGPAIPRKAPSELAQPEAQASIAPAGRRALDMGGPEREHIAKRGSAPQPHKHPPHREMERHPGITTPPSPSILQLLIPLKTRPPVEPLDHTPVLTSLLNKAAFVGNNHPLCSYLASRPKHYPLLSYFPGYGCLPPAQNTSSTKAGTQTALPTRTSAPKSGPGNGETDAEAEGRVPGPLREGPWTPVGGAVPAVGEEYVFNSPF